MTSNKAMSTLICSLPVLLLIVLVLLTGCTTRQEVNPRDYQAILEETDQLLAKSRLMYRGVE